MLAENQRQLWVHQSQHNPLPQDPQSVTRAFDRMAFEKIERQLRHADPVVRKKSLLAVREFLSEPLPCTSAIEARVPLALVDLVQDSDPEMRQMAATSLRLAMQYEAGCFQVLEHNRLMDLVNLIDDTDEGVREAAYRTLIEANRFESVRAEVAQSATSLPRIVAKLLSEPSTTLVDLALTLLDTCLNARRNDDALQQCTDTADGLSATANLLAPTRPASTRERAALLLARLCNTRFDSKVRAVQLGTVPLLVGLLGHPSLPPKLAAATALMSLTTVNEAKDAFFESNGCEALLKLIRLRHETTRIHVITLATNVGEHPGCRAQLQPAIPYFKELLDSTNVPAPPISRHITSQFEMSRQEADAAAANDTLRRFVSQAIRQIEFTTRPFELLPQPQGLPPAEPITTTSQHGGKPYDWEKKE